MLPDPVTWAALQVVAQRVRGISEAAGYHTDLGLGVVTTDPSELEDDPQQPFTVIVGGVVTDNTESSGKRTSNSEMDVTIEFAVPFAVGQNAELLAHQAMADIVRCIRGGVRDEAKGLRSLRIVSRRIGTPADGATQVIAQVLARAGLTESN